MTSLVSSKIPARVSEPKVSRESKVELVGVPPEVFSTGNIVSGLPSIKIIISVAARRY